MANITRSPAFCTQHLALAAEQYQSLFQSLKSWGPEAHIVESHFHGDRALFFLEFPVAADDTDPRGTLLRIIQSLSDKGFDTTHSYGCTCCNRVVTIEVKLPKAIPVTSPTFSVRPATANEIMDTLFCRT